MYILLSSWLCVDQCYKCVWFVQGGPCWTWPVCRDTGSVSRPCYCRVPPYWSKTAPPDGHHSTQQVKIPAFRNRHSTKVWRDGFKEGHVHVCDTSILWCTLYMYLLSKLTMKLYSNFIHSSCHDFDIYSVIGLSISFWFASQKLKTSVLELMKCILWSNILHFHFAFSKCDTLEAHIFIGPRFCS